MAKLISSAPDIIEEVPNGFGKSVALAGNCIVVGADHDGDADGAVYVFIKYNNSWSQLKKLSASDGSITDQFGASVAVSSDALSIAAGAPGDTSFDGISKTSSIYVYHRNSTTSNEWTQLQKFIASDGGPGDCLLGSSVAMENNLIVAGSLCESVYIFDTQPADGLNETSDGPNGKVPGLILYFPVFSQLLLLLHWWL
jgi:hypothetical protein